VNPDRSDDCANDVNKAMKLISTNITYMLGY